MVNEYNPIEDMSDYGDWVSAADTGTFDFSDYIHAQILQGEITTDILGAIVGWLWPEFVEVEGSIILASKMGKFLGLKKTQNLPDDEIEYWSNFTNIDGILPGIPVSFTAHLANVIREMWHAKLQNQFPVKAFVVEVVKLREQNELSVTFRTKNRKTREN